MYLLVQSWGPAPALAVGREAIGRGRTASPNAHGHCHQSGRMFLHNNQVELTIMRLFKTSVVNGYNSWLLFILYDTWEALGGAWRWAYGTMRFPTPQPNQSFPTSFIFTTGPWTEYPFLPSFLHNLSLLLTGNCITNDYHFQDCPVSEASCIAQHIHIMSSSLCT